MMRRCNWNPRLLEQQRVCKSRFCLYSRFRRREQINKMIEIALFEYVSGYRILPAGWNLFRLTRITLVMDFNLRSARIVGGGIAAFKRSFFFTEMRKESVYNSDCMYLD